jgi:hypothetical protein
MQFVRKMPSLIYQTKCLYGLISSERYKHRINLKQGHFYQPTWRHIPEDS